MGIRKSGKGEVSIQEHLRLHTVENSLRRTSANISPTSQLLQVPLVVSDLEAIGNYHTIWAGIYGCLNSVEKLRPVSPTHNNEEMDVPRGSQPQKELTSL